MYNFPKDLPKNSKPGVWTLQNFLLQKAEARLGRRDSSKKLYQPIFEVSGPFIRVQSNPDGAYAVLSKNAENYWPTALYELAHETIHLLNPIVGCTTYLEEGIAVAFSVEMSKTETNHPMSPDDKSRFMKAWNLVKQLPNSNNLYVAAKNVRDYCDSFNKANPKSIKHLFPGIDKNLAKKLCQRCKKNT